jgi:nucleoside-diphosphate-sugar epimerase
MNIFIAGASRGVGWEIAQILVGQPDQQPNNITALVRSPNPELEAMGMKVIIGDALDAIAVSQAMQAQPVDVVISTIGGLPKDGVRADYLGNKNLIDAAVQAGVKKFMLITSLGTGNSAAAIPPPAYETLKPVLLEKEQAENHLINSGLNYTIIRPGGLKSAPATGTAVLTTDHHVAGSIHRADVAALVCRCLNSPASDHQILAAFDQTMIYGTPAFIEFIP